MRFYYGLKKGDKLTVNDLYMGGVRTRRCTVVKEYLYFILADFWHYLESINKVAEVCGAVRVWDGWKGEE